MALGKKKDTREKEGYMKMSPKTFLIYLVIIVFCIIVIAPGIFISTINSYKYSMNIGD